jgi:hypothetical protein
MKKKDNYASYSNKVMIYHHELDMECINGTSFWLITEIIEHEPVRTYFYRIPNQYKDNSLLGELHERYAKYCPN